MLSEDDFIRRRAGFHHIPRPEDWPMMPVEWFAFELRPVGFFACNPAMNIPRVR